MEISRGLPCHRRVVAGIAGSCGAEMGRWFGQRILCGVRAVMTGLAIVRTKGGRRCCRRGVAHHRHRIERREILVTDIALRIAGRNMRSRLTKRRDAVTVGASIGRRRAGRGMIKAGRCPGSRGLVTTIALRRGSQVRAGFALGILSQIGATVTRRTQIGRAGVIHRTGGPDRRGGMAGITLRDGRWNMADRACLCIGIDVGAVMAGGALSRGASVVHRCRIETRNVGVTGIALRTGGHMIGRLTKRRHAVVTSRAASRHGGRCCRMIKVACRPSAGRGMAGIALCGGTDVCGGLDLGIGRYEAAAVTIGALTGCTGVIHRCRRPDDKAFGMTAITLRRGRNMQCRFGLHIREKVRPVVT